MKTRRWGRSLGMLLLALISGSLIGITWTAWRGVQLYLHPPRRTVTAETSPAAYGIAYQDITLQTADGLALAAWYVPSRNGCLILQAHGYGGRRDAALLARLVEAGYGVLAWDFRAHGTSEGDLSTLGGLELLDAEAALAFALTRPEAHCLGAWGESMGGVVLIRLAARYPEVAAVVSDSAFASLTEELRYVVQPAVLRTPMRLLGEWRTGVRFAEVSPVEDIARISPRPVLLIHGLADQLTPPEAALSLYATAGEPRELWLVPDAGHGMARYLVPAAYQERVLTFLAQALRPSSSP